MATSRRDRRRHVLDIYVRLELEERRATSDGAGEEQAAVLPFRRRADEARAAVHDDETGRADGAGGRT